MRRGSAFVTRKSETRSVADILPGYIFGEAAVICETPYRNSNVVAGKPCPKCFGSGWRIRKKKPRACAKCAQTGYVVDGQVHCVFRITTGALAEMLANEKTAWLHDFLQLNVIASILRETDRFFDRDMTNLLEIAQKFKVQEYDASQTVCNEGDRWMFYSVVLVGLVKMETKADGYIGKVEVCNKFSDFDCVRSPCTVITKENSYGKSHTKTVIASLGRNEMREEITKGIPNATKRYEGKHFKFIKVVGQGTSWRCYLAVHKLQKKYFAVRMIHKAHIDLDIYAHSNMARLAQQRELMEAASNPFVVRLYGSGVTDTHLFTVTEFMYGGELTNLLRFAPLRPNHVMFYAAGIILGLSTNPNPNPVR